MAQNENVIFRPVSNTHVDLDLNAIPEYQKNELCKWALELTRHFFSQPGVEEQYQIWLAERKRRLGIENT